MEISALVIGKSVLYDQPTHVGHESVDCRPLVDRSSADCWPLVGRLLVKCRPTVDRLTADMCRLVIKYTFTLFIIMNSSSHNQSKINLRSGPPPPPLQRKKKWQKREEGVCLASPSNFSEGKARSVCELTSVLGPLGGGQKGIEGGEAGEKGPFEPDTGVDCKQSHFRQTSKCDIAWHVSDVILEIHNGFVSRK